MSAEDMKMSMFYTYIQNRSFDYIPTHYIVGCNWDRLKVNELDTIVWATLNAEANRNWIHIEIVWDFNINQPSDAQYTTVNQLIQWILEKYPNMEVKGHWDFQPKNCPGKNFDWNKIVKKKQTKTATQNKTNNKSWTITFSLSRYYSVVPDQKRYYNWRTYQQDFNMNCAGDCLVTADWHPLTDDDMYKSVACPKDYPLGTKIYLEWVWVVTCHDRGWAITNNRIDMRCWIWDKALDNWGNCPTGTRQWYVLNE